MSHLALAARDVVAGRCVGLVVSDASPSSLESPGQKSRHEVHFLVKHYGRDGRKKGRERVWPAEDDGVARAPRGEYFKRRDDLRGRGEK